MLLYIVIICLDQAIIHISSDYVISDNYISYVNIQQSTRQDLKLPGVNERSATMWRFRKGSVGGGRRAELNLESSGSPGTRSVFCLTWP